MTTVDTTMVATTSATRCSAPRVEGGSARILAMLFEENLVNSCINSWVRYSYRVFMPTFANACGGSS